MKGKLKMKNAINKTFDLLTSDSPWALVAFVGIVTVELLLCMWLMPPQV
jgi:hypothetical protein